MNGQHRHPYLAPTNHSRAMLVLSLAIIGVVLAGMISQVAPRPRSQALPIAHPQVSSDVVPQFQASAAG